MGESGARAHAHLPGIVQYAFDEVMPVKYASLGSRFHVSGNTELPDRLAAGYHYPKLLVNSYTA
jgi:hypothetical protein